MKQTTADANPTRTIATLVTFTWGDGNIEAYAASDERVTWTSQGWGGLTRTWNAQPKLAVGFTRQHGGAADAPITIDLPADVQPATGLVTGDPHGDVNVLVEEMDPTDPTTLRAVFEGTVTQATLNASGLDELVRLTVAGHKTRLEIPSGIAQTRNCAWRFGDDNCGVDVDALKQSATVTAISGVVVTLDVQGPSSRYYHRGYIERDGARIMVREYTTGFVYTLVQPPPPSWLNETVTVAPGCDKTATVCDDRWSNLERFCGIGIGIPASQPLFEVAR